MSSRSKRLIKNTLIFGLGTFGSKALVMLVVPLCTNYVDSAGMGRYDLIYTCAELFKVVGVLCLPEALFRWLVDKEGGQSVFLSTWFGLYLIVASVFSVMYWLVWCALRFDDSLILFLLILTGSLYVGVQFGVRGVRRTSIFAVQGIIYALAMSLLSLIFVMLLGWGYTGLLIAILVANVVAIVFCFIFVPEFHMVSLRSFDSTPAKGMLKYSVPLIPNQASWWCINSVSRVAITLSLGISANGVYAIASKFPTVINMIASIFQMAWQEQAVLEFASDDRDAFYSSIFSSLSRLMCTSLLVLMPCISLFILLVLNPAYSGAKNVAIVLCFASLGSAFSSYFGTLYLCAARTVGVASTTLMGAIVSIALNFLLVDVCGLVGVAFGVVVSQFVVWVLRIVSTRNLSRIHIDWKRLIGLIALSVLEAILLCLTSDIVVITGALCFGLVVFFVLNGSLINRLCSKLLRRKI